jgi:septum site-determining protein MinC
VNIAAPPLQSIRFRGRSFLAFALTPEPPVADWLAELDKWVRNSPGFFTGKPVILDLAAVTLSESAIAHLIDQLAERGIRIMGLEGADPAALGPKLPPVLLGGRPGGEERSPAPPVPAPGSTAPPDTAVADALVPDVPAAPEAAAPSRQEPVSMLVETPVRSGQSVVFPFGEVTVLGSVASGAEIVAGGSIHIYGTLRGRAMAGSMGDARARIFCSRNEAELLAIDGYYQTAENMDASLRGRPVQVWLEEAGLNIEVLD